MKEFDTEDMHITSLGKFSSIVRSDRSFRLAFRGQSDYKYELLPSVGRLHKTPPFTDKAVLTQFEHSAFEEFRQYSYAELREKDDFIIMAAAQHHGLKTRLLDWTSSALAALFFAVENDKEPQTDGALFMCPPGGMNDLDHDENSPFKLKSTKFIAPLILSNRNIAQKGLFQCFHDPTHAFDDDIHVGKFRIPATSKAHIKREMFLMGISYNTFFPDLDGLSKAVNYVNFTVLP